MIFSDIFYFKGLILNLLFNLNYFKVYSVLILGFIAFLLWGVKVLLKILDTPVDLSKPPLEILGLCLERNAK